VIYLKRVYDSSAHEYGTSFLIDRLWPRGIKKENLHFQAWLKEAAPSKELRQWFAHDPQKWDEFQTRYAAELEDNPLAWQPLFDAARRGDITLLFAARDAEHSNAAALKLFLERKLSLV
jgi:uncharacterized protein YeaO (DUF488 family)